MPVRDEAKRKANLARHGIGFAEAERFGWATAVTRADARGNSGEERLVATGCIGGRLHVRVWMLRAGIMG